ncbi:MAG: 3-hydroxylacyl-ACP dehydratase [Treponema sp.]|jgi:predicted hotdog family 3-hydroxylacyl-ACP dehydratase|nr:3-hydroxylacyl-ACP dehydratase [Treponema sp.]
MDTGKIIEKEGLLALLPHREGMLLLSRILDYDPDRHTLRAEYDITRDCLFYDPAIDGIPSWISFECMAQGMAAAIGIENRMPGLGLILSVSNMVISRPVLKAGTTLSIAVTEDVRMNSVFTYTGEMSLGESLAAKAKFTVYTLEDQSAFEKEGYELSLQLGPH